MSQVTLFISAVSSEFAEDPALFPDRVRGAGDYRTYLRDKLTGPDVSVKVQEDFVAGGVLTLDKLVLYLRECDAVIQLVGDMTGAVASELAVESLFEREPRLAHNIPFLASPANAAALGVSYTQWEAYLAHHYGKRLIVAAAAAIAPRGGKHAVIGAQRASQDAHLARLQTLERYSEIHFGSREELVVEVLRTLRTILPAIKREAIPAAPLRLPYASLGALFVGREELLADIRASVSKARAVGSWPRQVVSGLGGLGKTRLAVEYAWRYRDEYTAVLLVNGESHEALERELAALSGVLHIDVSASVPQSQRMQMALDWLRSHSGWLLIVDNVDTEEARTAVTRHFADWSNGHVIITGRVTRWPRDVELLDLHVLAPDEATRFLLEATANDRATRADDGEQARILANDELGGLCLALEQASAYINKLGLSLADYRQRWATNAKGVRARADKGLMRYHEEKDVSLSVATTWQTTVDSLGAPARTLLQLLAWLAPAPLPVGLIDSAALSAHLQTLSGDAEADIEEAMAELRGYSLLSRPLAARFASAGQVHRLVQLVTRDSLGADERARTLAAMLDTLTAFANLETDTVRLAEMEQLPPHLAIAIAHGTKAELWSFVGPLLYAEGSELANRGMYAESELALRRALEIDERELGASHDDLARDLTQLGDTLLELGRLAEAEPVHRRALAIVEGNHEGNDPLVAEKLNALALMLCMNDRFTEAEPLVDRALEILAVRPGAHENTTTAALMTRARVLHSTGRNADAETELRRALALAEQAHGVDALETTHPLGNLSAVLIDLDQPEEAERLLEREIAILAATIGRAHPIYGHSLNNYARFHWQRGDPARAEPLLRESLANLERSLPDTHGFLRAMRSAHARVLSQLGRHAEAEAILRHMLATSLSEHGSAHPDIATAHARLGECLGEQARLQEAEIELRCALEFDEHISGDLHADTIRDLAGLGYVLMHQRRFDEALGFYTRAIAASDLVLGDDHEGVVVMLIDQSIMLRAQGEFDHALAPLRRQLAMMQRMTALDGSTVASTMLDLARTLRKTGRAEEAADFVREAMAVVRELPSEVQAVKFPEARLSEIAAEFGHIEEDSAAGSSG